MTAEHSPDPGRQRTVAELLQQYGDSRGDAPRRRRRAEQPDGAEAAAPVDPAESGPAVGEVDLPGDRTGGFSGGYAPPTSRWDELGLRPVGGGLFPDPGPPPPAAPPTEAVPEQRWGSGLGPGRSVDPLTGEPGEPGELVDPRLGGVDASATSGYAFPAAPRYPPGSPYPPYSPPGESPYRASGSPTHPPDPPTETLPRYPRARGATSLTRPSTVDAGPTTGQVSRAELFDDDPDGVPPAEVPSSAGPAGLADVREAEQAALAEPTGVAGWAVMVGQWVLGVVGGAALWVGFRYLWSNFPVIALVAAVVATVALVLVVRAIRHSDDPRTTMLAVLVGLVVTISPAVLLLAVR